MAMAEAEVQVWCYQPKNSDPEEVNNNLFLLFSLDSA